MMIEFGSWEPTHLRTGPETKAPSPVAAQISQHFPGNAWYSDTLEKERRQTSARGTHAVLPVLVSVALCHWVRRTRACLPSGPVTLRLRQCLWPEGPAKRTRVTSPASTSRPPPVLTLSSAETEVDFTPLTREIWVIFIFEVRMGTFLTYLNYLHENLL